VPPSPLAEITQYEANVEGGGKENDQPGDHMGDANSIVGCLGCLFIHQVFPNPLTHCSVTSGTLLCTDDISFYEHSPEPNPELCTPCRHLLTEMAY
jgi:hypothetical protein